MKFLIKDNNDRTIASNLANYCYSCYSDCKKVSGTLICYESSLKCRQGKVSTDNYSVFLCTKRKVDSVRLFKNQLRGFQLLSPELDKARRRIDENTAERFRKLRHNLVSYNAHISNEIHAINIDNYADKSTVSQLERIKRIITENPDNIAIALLRIQKNSKLIKAQFSVFDTIYEKATDLDLENHSIHKLLTLIYHTFWIDFNEKRVKVNIQSSDESVYCDYKTTSAALALLFDNNAKYVRPGSEFNIKIEPGKEYLCLQFDMVSAEILLTRKLEYLTKVIQVLCQDKRDSQARGWGFPWPKIYC